MPIALATLIMQLLAGLRSSPASYKLYNIIAMYSKPLLILREASGRQQIKQGHDQ